MENNLNNTINVTATCPCCGKKTFLSLDRDKYERYISGKELVQNIFPEMTVKEREVLISQMCYDCQDMIFGPI